MDIKLEITMNDQGQISLSGPVDQTALCLHLFGLGMEALANYTAQAAMKATIVTAKNLPGGNGKASG